MLDFVVFHLGSNSADVSIYMGHHPDVRSEGTPVEIHPSMSFARFQERDGSWSYLVNPVPDSEGPYFLHFFGASFTGAGSDREIFDRFLFDDRDHIFCAGPASNRY